MDVYIEKVHETKEPERPAWHLTLGNLLEPGLLAIASEQVGPITPNQYRRAHGTILASHLDGIDEAGCTVEAKASILGFLLRFEDGWGEPDTDEVPDHVAIQVQVQMICADCPSATVVCLRDGGVHLYRLKRDYEIGGLITIECEKFWKDHVEAQNPPTGWTPRMDVVKSIIRAAGTRTTVDVLCVRDYEQANDLAKLSKKAAEEQKARLIAALGDAEAADYGVNGKEVVYLEQTRRAYEVEDSTFRVLRIRKVK